MTSTGWCSLSLEILHQIASLVSLEGCLTCAAVCRSWHGPFTQRFYRIVHPKTAKNVTQLLATLDERMDSRGAYVRSLILPFGTDRTQVKQLVQHCPHLEKLVLPGGWLDANDTTDRGFWEGWPLMQRLALLETTDFEGHPAPLPPNARRNTVNGTRYPPQLVQNVRELRLTGHLKKLLTSLTPMPSLLTLNCRCTSANASIDDATVHAFISACPQLSTLRVISTRFWLHSEPTNHLETVRTLVLSHCAFMSVASFAMLSLALPHVEHLILDTANIPHQPSSRAQLGWHRLKHVTIYFHKDTIGLLRMGQTQFAACPSIQSLQIFVVVADDRHPGDDDSAATLEGRADNTSMGLAKRLWNLAKEDLPNAHILLEVIDHQAYLGMTNSQKL